MILSQFDGVGLTKVGGGAATCGDAARQVDNGSTTNPSPNWIDNVPTPSTVIVMSRPPAIAIAGIYVTATSGTGAAATVESYDYDHNYCLFLNNGTTAVTGSYSSHRFTGLYNFDTASHVFRHDCKWGYNPYASGPSDTFTVSAGFHDTLGTIDPVDGAYIRANVNSLANYQCITASNSTYTVTDSGVSCAGAGRGSFNRFVIDVTNVTKAEFRIVAEGAAYPATPTITNTTNIPTGTARSTTHQVLTYRAATTTNSLGIDLIYQQMTWDRLAA